MLEKKLVIGLFGFGVVGEGLYKVLQSTPSLPVSIKKIGIKNRHKKRNAPASLFTDNLQDILQDKEINVIVEAISDSAAGYYIVTTAMKNGKAVVSASKKQIAENLSELLQLHLQTGQPFLYEAAVAASIPILRNLEEYYDNDWLTAFAGIVNGSTNYILSNIFKQQLSFKEALLQAQQSGYAEADPSLDVEGHDAVHKTQLLLLHAFGTIVAKKEILFNGIQHVQPCDIQFAREKGYTIKLIAQAKKLKDHTIAGMVLPQFLNSDHILFQTADAYNGITIESSFAEQQFFYGKGAGALPTASALLSDISALQYGYKYGYKKWKHPQKTKWEARFYLKVYISFTDQSSIPAAEFEHIETWHIQPHHKYVIGTIHTQFLKKSDWWKTAGNSLILLPDAFVEDRDIKRIQLKSLAIAEN